MLRKPWSTVFNGIDQLRELVELTPWENGRWLDVIEEAQYFLLLGEDIDFFTWIRFNYYVIGRGRRPSFREISGYMLFHAM